MDPYAHAVAMETPAGVLGAQFLLRFPHRWSISHHRGVLDWIVLRWWTSFNLKVPLTSWVFSSLPLPSLVYAMLSLPLIG